MPSDAPRYSHPPEDGREAVQLLDHLRDVADRVNLLVAGEETTPAGEPLADVVRRIALVHDFGKATTWFQQHIRTVPGRPPDDRLHHHAPLGAFAAYYVLDASGFATETCLAGFVAVAKHHGRLPNVGTYVFERTTESGTGDRLDAIGKQIKDIHDNARPLADTVFEQATDDDGSWLEFAQWFVADDDLVAEIASHVARDRATERTDPFSGTFYGLTLSCWGTLVLADKTSAAGAPATAMTYEANPPPTDQLGAYVEALESSVTAVENGTREERLNHFRSKARRDVLDAVDPFVASDANVATITLPTGMGKTLTGLSAALAIRDATDGERVVYALPFTSIIDQVAAEARDIFEIAGAERTLLLDHHLADTRVDSTADDDSRADEADQHDAISGMLGESWRAGLTVTTFVQLFESLAGPRNTQSMKLPALSESVIVIDEPQSLPLDWWKLIPRLVEVLTEQYGAIVVSMTATQPRLFDSATELVDDVDTYFAEAERVRYQLHESVGRFRRDEGTPLDYDSAAATIAADARSGTAVLAICNTIDSARQLADEVANRVEIADVAECYATSLRDEEDDPVDRTVERIQDTERIPFVHLSTRLRPTDRLSLIRIVRRLRDADQQVVAVTTQLVEAGVDVSFETLYRDLAPVDSIVQAAGRCNRSFEQERGDVTIWWLDAPGEQTYTPATAVYDRTGEALLPVTVDALNSVGEGDAGGAGGEVLRERVVARNAVVDYYRRLRDDKAVGRASYAEYVDRAEAEELGRLSLIDAVRSIDVIVCRTQSDDDLVERIVSAYEEYEFEHFGQLLDETKSIRVSVPIYREDSPEADELQKLDHLPESDIRVLRTTNRRYDEYFDDRTGIVIPDDTVEGRFL